VSAARDFATANQLILVLKGSRPLVASPDGRVVINPTGNAGLGTAAPVDTLTGIIAGFMAQDVATLKEQADALNSTIAGLYVGGLAGILPQVNWECAQWWRQTYVSISFRYPISRLTG